MSTETTASDSLIALIQPFLDDELGPALRWWLETFSLVRDVATRGYPAHVTTYDRLLRDPLREVRVVPDDYAAIARAHPTDSAASRTVCE